MKKILIATALTLITASSAFAANTYSVDLTKVGLTLYGDKATASATTALIAKTSSGVSFGILTNSDKTGTGYAIITQHKTGTKLFGTSSDSTSIYSATIASDKVGVAGGGVTNGTVPTTSDSKDFLTSSWSTM